MKILHRDLKPANIFIRKDGSVAVGDFGLCIDLTELRNRATETSEAVGARFYIAPELEDGRVDEPEASSDVYSLGKVLYFILSGRHLLREEYAEPEYELRSAGPGAEMHFVYEVFQKTVKRNPNERVQNAIALLETLDSVIQRVQLKAHALNISLPQRCVFCAVGAYSFSRSSVNSLQGICNTCGNVQDFIGQVGELWWEQK
jgi:serine/threonine protein kinase